MAIKILVISKLHSQCIIWGQTFDCLYIYIYGRIKYSTEFVYEGVWQYLKIVIKLKYCSFFLSYMHVLALFNKNI